jgi:hypothetical protein
MEGSMDNVRQFVVGVAVLGCSSLRPKFGQGSAHKPLRSLRQCLHSIPHPHAPTASIQASIQNSVPLRSFVWRVRRAVYRVLARLACRIRTAQATCSLQQGSLKTRSYSSQTLLHCKFLNIGQQKNWFGCFAQFTSLAASIRRGWNHSE